jgi:hypothetical protein
MIPQQLIIEAARRMVPNARHGETYCVEWGTWRLLAVGAEAAREAAKAAKAAGQQTSTFLVTGKIEG